MDSSRTMQVFVATSQLLVRRTLLSLPALSHPLLQPMMFVYIELLARAVRTIMLFLQASIKTRRHP